MHMNKKLEFMYKQQHELAQFGGIAALLGWDQMTYMPPKGSVDRANQLALISRLSHEKFTSDKLYDKVVSLIKPSVFKTLKSEEQQVVNRLFTDIEKARKIPSSFVAKMAKTTTLAYQAWEKARKKNSFAVFAPDLREILDLEHEYISFIDLPGHPYNSLLDDYEEGMTVDVLQKEFSFLRKQLVALLDKITASDRYRKQQSFSEKIDKTVQQQICDHISSLMGLPEERARLDISTHPFTTAIGYDDVRITTNFERENPLFSFFSTVHETGHALYELGLPQNVFKDTVISDSPSLGLHESQSRFWENMIARSKEFWEFFYHFLVKKAPGISKKYSVETWYYTMNQVRPSLIRVEADELTYCLHIILRFELELGMISGDISVGELPVVWNEKMEKLLGITPSDDIQGVLQDMHWSGGSIGYFPTYAIGSIYAAQLFTQLQKNISSVSMDISKGNFARILSWLHTHIHQYGRLLTADDLIRKTCGTGLNSRVFINYLKDKYGAIYHF